MINRGKQWEEKFADDVRKTLLAKREGALIRLPDQLSGYKFTARNICDFLLYVCPNLFFLELKTVVGNTFPLSNLSQYEKLLQASGIDGVKTGVIIWFQSLDKVLYVPIGTIEQLKKDDKKSVNGKTIDPKKYYFVEIPGTKKRVFIDCDYNILLDVFDDKKVQRFYGGKNEA